MASELPLATLPRTVVLNNLNNNKYLRYTHEATEQQGLLQFTEDQVVSPYAKFHIERSTTSPDDLVHIRCAYNNKYWRRWNSTQYWIAAAADAPEEDQSKWSCTLFKPVIFGNGSLALFRFLHVQLNHYACLFSDPASSYGNFLYAGWEEPQENLMDVCSVIDRESIVVLPEQVAFKGNNGLYLRSVEYYTYGDCTLQFDAKNIDDPGAGFQVFTTSFGQIRVKSKINGKFWRREPLDRYPYKSGTIWASSNDTSTDDDDTVFRVVKVDEEDDGGSVLAMLSVRDNYFCSPYTPAESAYLRVWMQTIVQDTRIRVEELVTSREIYDVEFRLKDARIYGQTIIVAAKEEDVNDSPNPVTNKLKIKHTETKTSTWLRNVTVKAGVKTKIKTGIPFLVGGEVEISAEVSSSNSWGETTTTSDDIENEYDATVSPYSKLTVFLMATQGSCDVPFSYTQRDVGLDGVPVIVRLDDGLYTGGNSYNYQYETKEEPLPDRPPASLID